MDEARAREICLNHDLRAYSHSDCVAADRWVKDYAMKELRKYVRATIHSGVLREFTYLMARCHYGSAEVDEMLRNTGCYPKWL